MDSYLSTKYISRLGRKNVVPNKAALDSAVSLTACRERGKETLLKQCSVHLPHLCCSEHFSALISAVLSIGIKHLLKEFFLKWELNSYKRQIFPL